MAAHLARAEQFMHALENFVKDQCGRLGIALSDVDLDCSVKYESTVDFDMESLIQVRDEGE